MCLRILQVIRSVDEPGPRGLVHFLQQKRTLVYKPDRDTWFAISYFAYYNDVLRSKLLQEQDIVDSMESALSEGQFEVYLQPKYRIADHQMIGAEALVRWNYSKWVL